MSATPLVVRLMAEQRKRCLATILNAAESSSWWSRLSEVQQNTYREQVRGALAIFYDLARDVIKVSDEDTVRNDLALELIRSVHSQQMRITEKLGS
jgi:hypothetical protein